MVVAIDDGKIMSPTTRRRQEHRKKFWKDEEAWIRKQFDGFRDEVRAKLREELMEDVRKEVAAQVGVAMSMFNVRGPGETSTRWVGEPVCSDGGSSRVGAGGGGVGVGVGVPGPMPARARRPQQPGTGGGLERTPPGNAEPPDDATHDSQHAPSGYPDELFVEPSRPVPLDEVMPARATAPLWVAAQMNGTKGPSPGARAASRQLPSKSQNRDTDSSDASQRGSPWLGRPRSVPGGKRTASPSMADDLALASACNSASPSSRRRGQSAPASNETPISSHHSSRGHKIPPPPSGVDSKSGIFCY